MHQDKMAIVLNGLHHWRHTRRPAGSDSLLQSPSLKSEDTIIIFADAGFSFYLHGRDRKAKKLVSRIPATLLCVHGNHEVRPESLPELYHEGKRFGTDVMVENAFRTFFSLWAERSMT